MSVITVEKKVLEKNDVTAKDNREFFKKNKIYVVNIVSSPGAGKTSILEQSLNIIKQKISVAVIEGDVQTDNDARRVAKFNVTVSQIITNGGCHLDANLVKCALEKIDLKNIQLLIIENVGNLVCPANYDLGEDIKIVVASTTEGDDKPLKYPAMFRNSSVLIINKIDLINYVNCNLDNLKKNALNINPNLKIFETSCVTRQGIEDFCFWLISQAKKDC